MEEWPATFIDWSASIAVQEIEMRTLWRFQNYPFFWDNPTAGCRRIATLLAQAGRERAFQLARELCQFPGYFGTLPAYRRWLLTVAYREALRAAFCHPDVAQLVSQTTAEQTVLLHYLHIDQMTDEQLGSALGIFPVRTVSAQAVAAYRAFCDLLRSQGWDRDHMAPFPAYPTYPSALTSS